MKEAQFPMTIYIHVQAGRTDPKRSVGFLFGCPYAPMGLSWQSWIVTNQHNAQEAAIKFYSLSFIAFVYWWRLRKCMENMDAWNLWTTPVVETLNYVGLDDWGQHKRTKDHITGRIDMARYCMYG